MEFYNFEKYHGKLEETWKMRISVIINFNFFFSNVVTPLLNSCVHIQYNGCLGMFLSSELKLTKVL